MNAKRLLLISMSVFFAVSVARAEATPYLMRFDGFLDTGPLQGTSIVADFFFDDALPGPFPGATDIVYASIHFDDRPIFRQRNPGGFFLLDPSFSVFGPNFFVPGPFVPNGLVTLAFSEERIAYDYGFGLHVQQCRPGGACSTSVTQLQSIPEPSSLLVTAGVLAAAIAARRRKRWQ